MEVRYLSSDVPAASRINPPVMPRPVTGPARDRDAEERRERRKKKPRPEADPQPPSPEKGSRGKKVDIRV